MYSVQMSLWSQFQTKLGTGSDRGKPPPPRQKKKKKNSGGGLKVTTTFHANSHLRVLIQRQDCTASISFPNNCIQSRDFKTACFVFCFFHCLMGNRKIKSLNIDSAILNDRNLHFPTIPGHLISKLE